MKKLLIACLMMEAEVKNALEVTGSDAEVIWMEKGLHDRPEKLRAALQETMDKAEKELQPDAVLLAYGFCGNAMQGLKAGNYTLVLPRIDDCITLFIGSRERKVQLEGGVGTMFQTYNWTDERTIQAEKERLYEMYDEDEAEEIFEMMFGHYGRIAVLDTHCYDLAPVVAEAQRSAELLGFQCCVYDASNAFLRELLSGPWPEERFIVKDPGEIISLQDLQI